MLSDIKSWVAHFHHNDVKLLCFCFFVFCFFLFFPLQSPKKEGGKKTKKPKSKSKKQNTEHKKNSCKCLATDVANFSLSIFFHPFSPLNASFWVVSRRRCRKLL